MNPKTLSFVAIATSVLAVLLLLNTCRLNRKIDKQEGIITKEQLHSQELDSLSNKQKQIIYRQESIMTSNQSSIASLTDTIFNLKKKDQRNQDVIAYYQGRNVTSIKNVKVPYLDTIYMKHFTDSVTLACADVIQYLNDSTVKVGTVAADTTPYYAIKQTIGRTSITIDSLAIPDTLNLRFVEKKGGLFKKRKVEVQYFHSNPYVKTIGSNSVFYIPRRKSFFTRVILPVAIGLGAGLLIK